MHNRIIIIHPSEIIKQGLHHICKSLFDIDAIILSQIDEVKNYHEIRDSTILFLLDADLNQDQFIKAVEDFKKTNSVKIVLLCASSDKGHCKDDFEGCIQINASKSMIFEVLNPYVKQNSENTAKPNETGLTERERDVLKEVALGKTNKEIAEELFISFHTVISHRKNITEKLGIKSISGLTVYAILNKLIDTNTLDPESLI